MTTTRSHSNRRGRPPKAKPTDWEALCKKLQRALEKEIDEGDAMRKELVSQLREAQQQAHDNSVELIKAKGIIEYLETYVTVEE
jgi:hypothetical protein